MPGFNIGGFGVLGQPSNVVEPRRTHRWVFISIGRGEQQFTRAELLLLKTAARPKGKYGEAVLHHNQEQVYFAGKTEWDPIELTWYDTEQNPDVSLGVYKWFGTVSNLPTANVGHPATYKRTASLAMLNGVGLLSEGWTMYGTWPQDVDWKGLDYSSNEIQTCVVKMRYDRALRGCLNFVGQALVTSNCG